MACQAHPALVKQVLYWPVFFKFLVVCQYVHLLTDHRVTGPSRRPEPRRFFGDPASLAQDNILLISVIRSRYILMTANYPLIMSNSSSHRRTLTDCKLGPSFIPTGSQFLEEQNREPINAVCRGTSVTTNGNIRSKTAIAKVGDIFKNKSIARRPICFCFKHQ